MIPFTIDQFLTIFAQSHCIQYSTISPFMWSLVGFSAALSLGMIEDFGLVIAAVLGLLCLFTERVVASQKRSTKQHEKRHQVRA